MFAVYFTKEFKPGEHWLLGTEREKDIHPSDLKQHWKKGQLYSMGSARPTELPSHFSYVEIPEPLPGQLWNSDTLSFDAPPLLKFRSANAKKLHEAGFHDAAAFLENGS